MGSENSGRRPTPAAVKLLRGVTRRDRVNVREPKPPSGRVEMPEGLSPGAAEVWRQYAPVCTGMGTLTPADALGFATLCELEATARVVRAWKGTESGNALRQAVRLELATAAALRPYLALFGLDASSRARLQTGPVEEPVASKWAGQLG